ncbi:orotidine-5'-phosphate decarboxylase [Candidatus Daviesbacteria bacterium]|nr:orotidine-5'-phosphate decarboxylase [Candidatus Daviesbacteria bacterium]
MNSFLDKLKSKWEENKFVCIGLDKADFEFNKNIIDTTADLSLAYKPQSAFYEADGAAGLEALKKTIQYIREKDPNIPIILDAKRGDIGSTNEAYVKAIFDDLGVDAVTVHPYLGKEAVEPFLQRAEKGIIVLVRTSNPGAGEFQDLEVYPERSRRGKPLYQVVAEHVAKEWNQNNNCAVVVGATYPDEIKKVREIIGDMPILVPGIGAQGGDLEATIKNGLNSQKQGLIISSSRGIIFAPNPREATQTLHSQIQEILANV